MASNYIAMSTTVVAVYAILNAISSYFLSGYLQLIFAPYIWRFVCTTLLQGTHASFFGNTATRKLFLVICLVAFVGRDHATVIFLIAFHVSLSIFLFISSLVTCCRQWTLYYAIINCPFLLFYKFFWITVGNLAFALLFMLAWFSLIHPFCCCLPPILFFLDNISFNF